MTRNQERDIPPHMLHLYAENEHPKEPPVEHNDSALRLPRAVTALLGFLAKVRIKKPDTPVLPDSAKSAQANAQETQYSGAATARDNRWVSPA